MGMKPIHVYLMILFFTAMPVFAQDQPPSADDIVAKMQTQVHLTQDQVSAITPIIEKFASKRQELRQGVEDGTIERSDMRAQMKQMKTDENQELGQILSADQMGQWKQMQGQMRQHHDKDGSSGAPAAPSEHGGDNS
jgi:hypothetical protein